MRRIAAVFMSIVLSLPLISCNNANKKVIPKDQSPAVEDDIHKPAPADKSNTEKVQDTKKQDQNNNPENTSMVGDINNIPSDLSNEKIGNWMPGRNKEHKVPQLNAKYKSLLVKYDGYFTGDESSKIIYLTFDEGYENGYTGEILDILKANNVKSAFFVTKPYIKSSQELVKRMVTEGHIVGNHTDKHPSMPDVSDERVIKEIKDTADYFKEITGEDMPRFIRPPMGEWSERTLYISKAMGYKTILWSVAHKDWDTKNQPGKDKAYNYIDTYYHNGAIILLHAVSKSNTEALDSIIKNLQSKGYRFAELTELGSSN